MACLVYLALGSDVCRHQAVFSILSARRFAGGHLPGTRVVVYTDTPGDFEGLANDVVALGRDEVNQWVGRHKFVLRAKIVAVAQTLRERGEPVVYVDTDTFFIAPPGRLFDRIRPGRGIMERVEPIFPIEMEGTLRRAMASRPQWRTYSAQQKLVMWNSGVVGVHPSDQQSVASVLELSDILFEETGIWYSEQFAWGAVLTRNSELSPADDVIYHYCHPVLKRSFARTFKKFSEKWGSAPVPVRAANCMRYRPRWDAYNTVKIGAKRVLQALGALKKPLRFDFT